MKRGAWTSIVSNSGEVHIRLDVFDVVGREPDRVILTFAGVDLEDLARHVETARAQTRERG